MSKSDLVLLALDDEQTFQLLEQALNSISFHVRMVKGFEALNKALQDTSPALVIIGQQFDGKDEVEIASGLLERFPTMPVQLLLMHDSPETIKRAIRVGASDCLVAPLHIEDIVSSVENCIKRANRIGDWTRREVNRTTASLVKRLDEMQKLETIVEHIDDGVIIIDEKSNLLLINPAARRTFGIWLDDPVKGKPMGEILPHPDLAALLSQSLDPPLPIHEITFKDGRVLAAQCTPIPRIGLAITMQDITHLKQIDRLKNEFVNTVSHDLRSPLTAIVGYVDLLERVGPVNNQQRDFIQRVKNSVKHITALVNDLLDLGRIEAGFDTQKEVVPLDGIIRYTLETLEDQISAKKIRVELHLPGNLPQMRGNPIRLRQMLDNLIGNAIKYSIESGEISISMEAQEEQLLLRVEDNGPGIPPADQPHIFEKFYRASNVPKGIGGSGLGLSIVKSIVENHQGRIWVDSLLGKGTTFTVVLPLHVQAMRQLA